MISKNIKIAILGSFCIGLFTLNGCSKFLDVNENPNNPETAAPKHLLPTSEAALGIAVGNSFQVYGNMLAQYWAQNPSANQYIFVEQYAFTNSDFNYSWRFLYSNALINLQLIIDNGDEEQSQYAAIAYVLKAYGLQLATDAFGDVPNSEALKGAASPSYDKQEVVYDSIFQFIEKGRSMMDPSSDFKPGSEDLVFQGNMDDWIKFANTLELKTYMRLSQIDPEKAKTGITALYADNAAFLNDDAGITYSTTGGNQNPLYINMVGLGKTQNLVASGTALKAFIRNNDPRRFTLYDPLDGQDTIAYIAQGNYSNNSKKLVAPPSALVAGNAQMAVLL